MAVESDAAFGVALAHHEAGRSAAAEANYRAILIHDPGHADSLHLLGLLLVQRGEPEAGAKLIRQAMAVTPASAPHYNSLGLALRALGRDAEAILAFEAAVALRPGSAEVRNNLASTLRDMGRHAEAFAEYRRASARGPGIAEIWYNLASALANHGSAVEAETCFRRAIALQPDLVNALVNYGRFLIGQVRWTEAAAWLAKAARYAPGDARIWTNLGVAHQESGDSVAAEASYRRAILVDPGCADAHYNLGCLLSGDGRAEAAIACHAAAIAADPAHGAAWLARSTACLPIIYRAADEIPAWRARYVAALEELAAAARAPLVAQAVAAAIGASQPFFLPYQGENDKAPQAAFGGLVCGLAAAVDRAPSLAPPPGPDERIRLGIVCGFFQDHTIFRLFLEGWLTHLDRGRFEVIAFHTGHVNDAATARAAALCGRFISGLATIDAWRSAIESAAPHVLIYPEVGMDPICGGLAARRLAPVQCVAWGHPETTGMPTMDYFLTAATMEPPDGALHYTEVVVALPGLGLHYSPDPAPPPLDRAALGLDPALPAYWSGQALYKYAPGYDAIFPRIAAAVGPCRFVFVGFGKSQAVTTVFRDRLARAFDAFGLVADEYCVMAPPMPQTRFLAAVAACDVVLDTPAWSGGKSSLDCLSLDSVIVTLPGPLMRGRHTAAMLRRIGCEATIAGSLDEYVAIASRLGRDHEWRSQLRRLVSERKHLAFGDLAPIRALETFLSSVVARRAAPARR